MTNPVQSKYDMPIVASPVKSFFVSMLTRDIRLEDAILDLLDNCVDGALRTMSGDGDKPYSGYWASITFNKDTFEISDNCGGIPWELHGYAFRMGRAKDRPPDKPGSVGAYGIGMKRAIFKIGRDCLLFTRNGDDQYEIVITPEWMDDESRWNLDVRQATRVLETDGTTIIVGKLNPGISEQFGEGDVKFKAQLSQLIATHYSAIINKGFEVRINGDLIQARSTKLVFDDNDEDGAKIRPFIFRTSDDGVDVFLAVGFTRAIPSQSEILDEQEDSKYSSEDAGWTVLCNDRAVLYCDRSELTGWGEAGVPRYHTQFIAISGIVEFKSDNASKLPTTTTKRGIDASSKLYLQVKNKMREGMRYFTDYTNKWKGRADESKDQIKRGKPFTFDEIKGLAAGLELHSTTRTVPVGQQYKPTLPTPPTSTPTKRRISYLKDIPKIRAIANFFDDPDMEPGEVGEKCFDILYEEASKR